jgi:hypothetical protein
MGASVPARPTAGGEQHPGGGVEAPKRISRSLIPLPKLPDAKNIRSSHWGSWTTKLHVACASLSGPEMAAGVGTGQAGLPLIRSAISYRRAAASAPCAATGCRQGSPLFASASGRRVSRYPAITRHRGVSEPWEGVAQPRSSR